ncbi:MAG: hypothetical protein HKN17_10480 [Rhodothermales bacterium]|nr:hypothetical protein [Rhodothermales bacterium]
MILILLAASACDSSDPASTSDDDDVDVDDGAYSCTAPSPDDLSVGESKVVFDYADFQGDDDISGDYTGRALFGTVFESNTEYSTLYLPEGDGSTRNLTIYNEATYVPDGILEEGTRVIDATSAPDFRAYLYVDRGNISERNGGFGTLTVSSVERNVATGTFEFGDSFSAFCGAFKAEVSADLDPAGFDPF